MNRSKSTCEIDPGFQTGSLFLTPAKAQVNSSFLLTLVTARTKYLLNSFYAYLTFCFLFGSLLRAENAPENPGQPPSYFPSYRIRYTLRISGDDALLANPSLQTVIATIPTGGWLTPGGSDIAVQAKSGEKLPVITLSHNPKGDTIIQFQRKGKERYYWVYAVSPNALVPNQAQNLVAQEGLTAEFREWKGDLIDSWAAVREGLQKNSIIIGNAIVPNIMQRWNPIRPDQPRNFTVSYRGYFRIKDPGSYSFFVNAVDACFLFIDGYKVFERTGSNAIASKIPPGDYGKIELTAGVHPFEVHHVCGNNPDSQGRCSFYWKPPGATKGAVVPREAFAQSLLADVTSVESATDPVAVFTHGMEDAVISVGITLYTARFEAYGATQDPSRLEWDFGDGTKGRGKSVQHVYFKSGDFQVSLKSAPNMPPFSKTIHLCPPDEQHNTYGPPAFARAIKGLASEDWSHWDIQRLNQAFDFFLICGQPYRWPAIEKLARYLISQPGNDPKRRVIFYTTLMQAMAEQGRAKEAVKLMDEALHDVAKLPSLQAEIILKSADIHWTKLKDLKEASRLYEKLVTEQKGMGVPAIRQAAIHWGDLFVLQGDMVNAAEHYRLANTLGGEKFAKSSSMEAVQSGTLLRVAEQKLRSGKVRECRQLLEKMELEYPEQKLEALYRFLRAEADRYGGQYEEALEGYNVLVKLTQASSFMDRAFYGIADTYRRQGNYQKTLDWLQTIAEKFPDFYKKEKIRDYQKAVEGRLERIKEAGSGTADITFKGFTTGFEPEEPQTDGKKGKIYFQKMLGIDGPTVGVMEGIPLGASYEYSERLLNITANGNYWVEFWYREYWQGGAAPPEQPTSFAIQLYGKNAIIQEGDPTDDGTITAQLNPTYGEWQKVQGKVKAPVTQDGRLMLKFNFVHGLLQLDGVKITPISDLENDLIRSFMEGIEEE